MGCCQSTELDEYFLKAADAGARVAALLEAPICELPNASPGLPGRVLSYGKNLKPTGWSWGGKGYGKASSNNGFSRFGRGDDGGILSHSSTVERLYAWEKKLFLDVRDDNLRKQTLHHMRRILTTRQTARCFPSFREYHRHFRALTSIWASRPRD